MKKQSLFAAAILSCLCLSSCRNVSSNASITPTETEAPQETEAPIQVEFKEVEMMDPISTDDIAIEFTNKSITASATWEQDDGTRISLDEENEQVYFIIFGAVKNRMTTEADVQNGLKLELVLDGKYKYPVTIEPVSLYSVLPLETAEFMMYAEIPEAALEECESYELLVGFNDGLASAGDLYACENGYRYTGTLEEYGSAESIQNFQTFSEFMVKEAEKADISYQVKEKEVWIGSNEGFWVFELDDGTTFSLVCKLVLNYGIYDIYDDEDENCGYGAIKMKIEQTSKFDPTAYYSGAKRIEIISDTGSVEVDDSSSLSYSYDYDYASNTSNVTFSLWANKYSFVELQNVVNGNDLKLVVEIEGDKSARAEIDLSENGMQAALVRYLEFYKALPLAEFD